MRLLCFQAKRFWWKPFERTLPEAAEHEAAVEVRDAVVAFVHVEVADADAGRADSVFRQTLKHLRGWPTSAACARSCYSFTHLGGESAEPHAAHGVLMRLAERLRETGYETHVTPFGWFNEWDLSVHGESLAKVWKQI